MLVNTDQAHRAELSKLSGDLLSHLLYVRREKAVYHTMNLLHYDDAGHRFLVGEGWVPRYALGAVSQALEFASVRRER